MLKVNTVLQTSNYKMFKHKKGNRDIEGNAKLEAELRKHGMLVPAIVNDNYEIIDGQHRITLAEEIKIPVLFIILPGAGEQEMLSINNTARQWSPVDFVNLYKKQGVEVYKTFSALMSKYDVLIGVLASLAWNSTDGSRPMSRLKSGELRFVNYDFLVKFLDFHKEIMDKTALTNGAAITRSLYQLFRLKKFDEDRLFDKAGLIAERLKGIGAQGMMTKVIIESYNQRLRADSEREIKFHLNGRGDVEFFEKPKLDIANCEGTSRSIYRL